MHHGIGVSEPKSLNAEHKVSCSSTNLISDMIYHLEDALNEIRRDCTVDILKGSPLVLI